MKEYSKQFYKNISRPIVRFFIKAHITANQITVFNIFFMTFGAGYFFAIGRFWLALLVCGLSAMLDYADGDVAKATSGYTPAGKWIDTFGDIIKQNGIMGAIAVGTGMPPLIIVIFFVSNAALNVISFHYNSTFGFDSYTGNELFRKYMDMKPTLLNKALKNIIDPTSSWIGLIFGTVRYFIVIGIIFGILPIMFYVITTIDVFKAIFMFAIYALHLAEYKKLWLCQALAILDKERQEFYQVRNKGD